MLVKSLYTKASKAYYAIRKHYNSQNGTPVKTLLKLFDSTIKPTMLYGCEVWGGYLNDFSKPDFMRGWY